MGPGLPSGMVEIIASGEFGSLGGGPLGSLGVSQLPFIALSFKHRFPVAHSRAQAQIEGLF